ncbi:hypothetical protein AGROH133_13868 [Agrobacterium tumefaciens]|nr:hypothetical protein AGROH133_13868 [Agrobacterium tumefaciens]
MEQGIFHNGGIWKQHAATGPFVMAAAAAAIENRQTIPIV